MTEIVRSEREQAWLSCYRQRVGARLEWQRQAEACCVDCGDAGRFDPADQATCHTRRAKEAERDAHLLKAETFEKTAARLFTGALMIFGLSVLVLAFSLIGLLDG